MGLTASLEVVVDGQATEIGTATIDGSGVALMANDVELQVDSTTPFTFGEDCVVLRPSSGDGLPLRRNAVAGRRFQPGAFFAPLLGPELDLEGQAGDFGDYGDENTLRLAEALEDAARGQFVNGGGALSVQGTTLTFTCAVEKEPETWSVAIMLSEKLERAVLETVDSNVVEFEEVQTATATTLVRVMGDAPTAVVRLGPNDPEVEFVNGNCRLDGQNIILAENEGHDPGSARDPFTLDFNAELQPTADRRGVCRVFGFGDGKAFMAIVEDETLEYFLRPGIFSEGMRCSSGETKPEQCSDRGAARFGSGRGYYLKHERVTIEIVGRLAEPNDNCGLTADPNTLEVKWRDLPSISCLVESPRNASLPIMFIVPPEKGRIDLAHAVQFGVGLPRVLVFEFDSCRASQPSGCQRALPIPRLQLTAVPDPGYRFVRWEDAPKELPPNTSVFTACPETDTPRNNLAVDPNAASIYAAACRPVFEALP